MSGASVIAGSVERSSDPEKHDWSEMMFLYVDELNGIDIARTGKHFPCRIRRDLFEIGLEPQREIGFGPVLNIHRILDPADCPVDLVEAEIGDAVRGE